MKSELVPVFRDLQKYLNEPEMGRTGESVLIPRCNTTCMSCLRHFLRLNCELMRKFIRFTV